MRKNGISSIKVIHRKVTIDHFSSPPLPGPHPLHIRRENINKKFPWLWKRLLKICECDVLWCVQRLTLVKCDKWKTSGKTGVSQLSRWNTCSCTTCSLFTPSESEFKRDLASRWAWNDFHLIRLKDEHFKYLYLFDWCHFHASCERTLM